LLIQLVVLTNSVKNSALLDQKQLLKTNKFTVVPMHHKIAASAAFLLQVVRLKRKFTALIADSYC